MRLMLRLVLRFFDAVGKSHGFLRWGCPEVAQRTKIFLSSKMAGIILYRSLIFIRFLVATGGLEPPTPAL